MRAPTAASRTSCSATPRGATTRRRACPTPRNPRKLRRSNAMPVYNPPVRDMQFVMHEVLKVADEYKAMPRHAEVDADTINAILEEGGKFAAEVTFPLNMTGDEQGCLLDKNTHEVATPKGFKEAYHKYVE